tara:strand:+ start:298 stop:795 length:498 start_codon:yes stop_codon:yes gene_type:complete
MVKQTKEERAKKVKEYRDKNKEKIAKRLKEYYQTPKGKMSKKIAYWKFKGLVCEHQDEYEYIYDRWFRSERCEYARCNKEYTKDNNKCMDHCHLTGLFRDILCHSCNVKRTLKENSSGIPNIYKTKYGWKYIVQINMETHSKRSKDLEWLKQYKIGYENKYLYNN